MATLSVEALDFGQKERHDAALEVGGGLQQSLLQRNAFGELHLESQVGPRAHRREKENLQAGVGRSRILKCVENHNLKVFTRIIP